MDLSSPLSRNNTADIIEVGEQTIDATEYSEAAIMRSVRAIGGGMIGLGIIVVVLTEVFTLPALDISSGPFSGIITSIETTGASALGLLVIGLLVLAANSIMSFFGSSGF